MSDSDILEINAVTLAVRDMPRAVRFYRSLGFALCYGGEQESFVSFRAGRSFLNLIVEREKRWSWWGRVIFFVADVDAFYDRAAGAGHRPDSPPADAPWGERFFHISDPDGHELSFAAPIRA